MMIGKYLCQTMLGYMNFMDIMKIRESNDPYFSDIITPAFLDDIITNCIRSRLHELNLDWLPAVLTKTNSVISGSFPLQCILNEYWNKSDINIYELTDEKSFTPLQNLIYYDIPRTHAVQHVGGGYQHTAIGSVGTYDYKYVKNRNKYVRLQVIAVRNKKVDNRMQYYKTCKQYCNTHQDFINENFDFDICKIIFDENTTRICGDATHETIYNKQSGYKLNRGFTNVNYIMDRLVTNHLQRLVKYDKRGITIIPNDFIENKYMYDYDWKVDQNVLTHSQTKQIDELKNMIKKYQSLFELEIDKTRFQVGFDHKLLLLPI
jgi:hypothetical protein